MTCPFDKKELIVSQIIENQFLIKGLQKSSLINITCDKHPNNQAEFCCIEHKVLICSKCAIIDHQGHALKDIKREDLVQFCTKANNIIDEESQKLAIMKDGFNSYIASDVNLTSEQFMQMVECLKRVLRLRESERQQNGEEEEKKGHTPDNEDAKLMQIFGVSEERVN